MAESSFLRGGCKPIVEDCLALDLAWLIRLGPISDGQAGSGEVHWSIEGEPTGSARFRLDLRSVESARLSLRFQPVRPEGPGKTVEQVIPLAFSAQHFGGRRWWLRCPVTGKRARVLYLPSGGKGFASRAALGLAYRIERLDGLGRAFERLERARRRFNARNGSEPGEGKPSGMWRRTYLRRVEQLTALDAGCARQLARLISS